MRRKRKHRHAHPSRVPALLPRPRLARPRERIRERAGDACERCDKPNGVTVETVVGKVLADLQRPVQYMFWRVPSSGIWHAHNGAIKSKPEPAGHAHFRQTASRIIRAKCGAAHLNNVAGDDREENLAWLCDWCHFHHDAEHHHKTRGARKDAARPILAAVAQETMA